MFLLNVLVRLDICDPNRNIKKHIHGGQMILPRFKVLAHPLTVSAPKGPGALSSEQPFQALSSKPPLQALFYLSPKSAAGHDTVHREGEEREGETHHDRGCSKARILCAYVCMFVAWALHARTIACVYVCMCVCLHVSLYACMCGMCVCVHVCLHVCLYATGAMRNATSFPTTHCPMTIQR